MYNIKMWRYLLLPLLMGSEPSEYWHMMQLEVWIKINLNNWIQEWHLQLLLIFFSHLFYEVRTEAGRLGLGVHLSSFYQWISVLQGKEFSFQ